jgi:uroporphyrinogen III methyltransferase/synthase
VIARVYLIGTGSGAPDLITVRGLRCLETADVVVYDPAVHPRLLRHARAGAEKIDIGTLSSEPVERDAVCYLLAEKAREGKVVARLKSGDAVGFDQSAFEAAFLRDQNIQFEVVPGLLPAVAAAAYAGLALDTAAAGATVRIVRGLESRQASESIDWTSLADTRDAVILHGDSAQLASAIGALVSHGRSANESAALVFDATLPRQETTVGTIGELARRLHEQPVRHAGVLIIGLGTAPRERLRWFDRRPLFGLRVLVTRAADQAVELVELLEAQGAEAIEAPMIRIAPPEDYGPLDAVFAELSRVDWIVFSSVNAVDAFIGRLLALPFDLRALHGVRLCAVGAATSERLWRHGLKVDVVPTEYRAEALAQAIAAAGDMRGASVLIPRSDIGRDVVAQELRERGAHVTEVVAYRTVAIDPEREGGPDVFKLFLEQRLDAVTFTSASAVNALVALLGEDPAIDLLRNVVVVCIGPLTAEAAARHGIQTTVVPREYTVPGLVGAMAEYFQARALLKG